MPMNKPLDYKRRETGDQSDLIDRVGNQSDRGVERVTEILNDARADIANGRMNHQQLDSARDRAKRAVDNWAGDMHGAIDSLDDAFHGSQD